MNKTDLIAHIAKNADISQAVATRALDAALFAIKGAMRKGDDVRIVGFGAFAVGKRAARTGRNPRTGAALKIKAARVPRFRPSAELKRAVN